MRRSFFEGKSVQELQKTEDAHRSDPMEGVLDSGQVDGLEVTLRWVVATLAWPASCWTELMAA